MWCNEPRDGFENGIPNNRQSNLGDGLPTPRAIVGPGTEFLWSLAEKVFASV